MKYITWYLSKMSHVTMLFSLFTLYDKISAKDFVHLCTVYDKKNVLYICIWVSILSIEFNSHLVRVS